MYRTIYKTFRLLVIALCSTISISAQDGTSAYNLLNITSSSKIYGLGGVNISLVDDDIAVSDMNPALLGAEMSGQVMLNYMHYVGGSNFAGFRYGHSAGERGAWSASMRYFGYGSITEAQPDGSITGSFSPKDITFGGSYSHDINSRLRGGIALKMIYSSYAEYSAMALATDLGINYYDDERDLSLSLVAANLGGQIKRFDQSYDRLPFDLRIGWSQTFGTFPVRFSITAWNLTKWKLPYVETSDGSSSDEPVIKNSFKSNLFRHLVFGADLISSESFYIGIGYNYKTRTDMATYSRNMLSGVSLAAGISVSNFNVGIALAQPHSGATTFMLNLNCNLNDIIR